MISNIINNMNRFKKLSMLITNIKERKNKKLMIDKILSYSPVICEGLDKYNDANRNFWLLIILGGILKDFLMISLPCCILAVFFIARMIQFIKYKTIYDMVKELAKDLLFKFESKYGETKEFDEFYSMLNKYEQLVTKMEYILNTINEKKDTTNERNYKKDLDNTSDKNHISTEIIEGNSRYMKKAERKIKHKFNKNNKNDMEIIGKAIDLFKDEDGNKGKAILLKNRREEDKNLKVYLYKKSVDCEKNIL